MSDYDSTMDGAGDEREISDALLERVARSEFHRWAGLELTRVESGEVEVTLQLQPHHLNLVGIVHGGIIAAVADTAAGLALRTVLQPDATHVTGQLNVQYLSPGTRGQLIARGRVVKAGRRVGFAEADVVDERGRLIARANATFIVMPRGEAEPSG